MHDPVFTALTTEIAAIERVLSPERIFEVVVGSFRQLPVARRTLDLLIASPGLLTDEAPETPPALASLLLRLHEAGALTVQPPRCARCGQQRLLRRVSPTGRICDPCGRRLEALTGACVRCGQTRRLQPAPGETAYCKRCWSEMKTEATARIIREVRRHRRVAETVIRHALERMPSPRDRRVRLMLELVIHGEEWFNDPAAGTVLFGSFYDLLYQAGARLPERRCGGCGTTRTLTERVDGRVSCRRCYRIAHQTVCDGCSDVTNVERVLSDGRRLCQRCTNKLPDENAVCVSCGNHRLIAFRGPEGPLCSMCRGSSQQDTCTVCGQVAPCLFHGSKKAICKACSDEASVDIGV